jgi:hypothetical protein
VNGATALLTRDEPRVFEDGDVLQEGRQRHRERGRDFARRRLLAFREARKDRAPRRVGESVEGAIEVGRLIVNHMV